MFTSAKDLIAKKAVIGERKEARLDVTIEGLGAWRFRVPNVEVLSPLTGCRLLRQPIFRLKYFKRKVNDYKYR